MSEKIRHKRCVQNSINILKKTHLCKKEFPLFREGDIHFIDAVGFPHKEKTHLRPIAIECECGSSKAQQMSNKLDLLEFKRRYPEAIIFQVNDADEIDFRKLSKFRSSFNKPKINRF